jgi:hypothetical protein
MRSSIFRHTFIDSGINGVVNGEIVVTMNDSQAGVITESKILSGVFHKIEFFIDGALWKAVKDLDSEMMVLNDTETLLKEGKTEMKRLATQTKEKDFSEQLDDIFKQNT